MDEKIKKIITWLRTFPVWVRVLIVALVAAFAVLCSLNGCSTIRTTMNSAGEIHTSVNQSALDSTHISINLFATPNKK